MIRSLMQLAVDHSQPRRGQWLRRRDEAPVAGTTGAPASMNGDGPLSERTVYAVGIALIVFSAVVGTFSSARDISWRLSSPHNLWEPALWETTSAIVAIALLPLPRRGARLIGSGRHQILTLGLALAGLALAYSALHIAGMGVLREWAYALAGWTYRFPWARQIPYELRKDLFSFTAFVAVFWLGQRAAPRNPTKADEATSNPMEAAATVAAPFWLRDGRSSILINPCDVVSVSSAGNYVEYQLTGGRNHLIRATLQSQEARLAPFGIVRVHRGRLLNLGRIVALEWRASGDFELRLDTGETVVGSRRFKAAVANIGA